MFEATSTATLDQSINIEGVLAAFLDQVTTQGIIVGALITLITSLILAFFNHFLATKRSSEERKENFRLKLYELKIQAAQIAYQYVFKVYRTQNDFSNFDLQERAGELIKLKREARVWLDGQAFILGKNVYESVFTYFNSVGDKGESKAMDKAIISLKSIVTDRINEI